MEDWRKDRFGWIIPKFTVWEAEFQSAKGRMLVLLKSVYQRSSLRTQEINFISLLKLTLRRILLFL